MIRLINIKSDLQMTIKRKKEKLTIYISVSRDIIVLSISITIIFVFLDFLESLLTDFTYNLNFTPLIITIIILGISFLYLFIQFKRDKIKWLKNREQRVETYIQFLLAILIESSINLILNLTKIIFLFSKGKLVIIIILCVLIISSLVFYLKLSRSVYKVAIIPGMGH